MSYPLNLSNLEASVASGFDSKIDELVELLKKIEAQDQQTIVLV